MTVEQGAYNDVNLVETNGFRARRSSSRAGPRTTAILTFTSDNGLYDNIEAYGNGDSGVYPGSGPECHCTATASRCATSNSYGNTLGASGTAGNGTWTHDTNFHDNGAGIANDSFAPGHPGMPQDCSKWAGNDIYSNNLNFFDDDNEAYCNSTPFEKRRKEVVCPLPGRRRRRASCSTASTTTSFRDNHIYDQRRNGVRLFAVPARRARRERPGEAVRHVARQPVSSATRSACGPDGTRDRNGSTSTGTSRACATAGRTTTTCPAAR